MNCPSLTRCVDDGVVDSDEGRYAWLELSVTVAVRPTSGKIMMRK